MIDRGQDGPEPGPTKYKSSIGHITNNRLILICGLNNELNQNFTALLISSSKDGDTERGLSD